MVVAPKQAGALPQSGGLLVAAMVARRKAAGSGRSGRIAAAGINAALRGAAGLDPLMQKPGGDHREVGERPRRAILNP